MVGVVEGWEVEEGFGTDAGALTARAGSVLMGHPEGQCLCSEAQWDRQEMAEAISALHGFCFSVLNSGLCLPASLLGAVPALSCCAFCLQLLLAAHPQSASPSCFVERRKYEHAGEIFWSSRSLAQRRGKCSICSAISTLALWKAWWVSWKTGRFSALETFCSALL